MSARGDEVPVARSRWMTLASLGLNPDRVRRLLEPHADPGWALRTLGRAEDDALSGRLTGGGVGFLLPDDAGYPLPLAELPDRPPWLFVKGGLPQQPAVAVVGSRRASAYGLRLAEDIGRLLARRGWPVVSGLARGVDAAAHRGVVSVDGVAVAVLGSGVDVWYPRSNRRLGEAILAGGGAVVSEFPPGTLPEAWRFPFRNRIISGLSGVVVVVEAALRSGALITARHALDQGREVFAVPGDLGRETSAGTNLLIRDGAHPLTDVEALPDMIELVMGPAPAPPGAGLEVAGVPVGSSLLLADLVERSAQPAAQVLAEVATLEMQGRLRTGEGWVSPV